MPNDPSLMIELAKRRMKEEMPAEMAASSIKEASWVDRLFDKVTQGQNSLMATSRRNNITYYPEMLQDKSQDDINDYLAHELTHVRQNQREPSIIKRFMDPLLHPMDAMTPYHQVPEEMEAFQTEKNRALTGHRVPPRTPSFEDGLARTDIQLPVQRAQK